MSRTKILKYAAKLSLKERFNVLSTIRNHHLEIDEPSYSGGTDKGPNPFELVLAALGGCQIITMSFYAPKLAVKVKSVETTVEGDIDAGGFMGRSGVRPGFQGIRVHTKLVAEGDEDKIKELIKISEECCPVFDTIKKGAPVEVHIETV